MRGQRRCLAGDNDRDRQGPVGQRREVVDAERHPVAALLFVQARLDVAEIGEVLGVEVEGRYQAWLLRLVLPGVVTVFLAVDGHEAVYIRIIAYVAAEVGGFPAFMGTGLTAAFASAFAGAAPALRLTGPRAGRKSTDIWSLLRTPFIFPGDDLEVGVQRVSEVNRGPPSMSIL